MPVMDDLTHNRYLPKRRENELKPHPVLFFAACSAAAGSCGSEGTSATLRCGQRELSAVGPQLTWKVHRWSRQEHRCHSDQVMLGEPHQCCTGCLSSCPQQPQKLALEAHQAGGVGGHHLTQGLRMGTNASQGFMGCSVSSGPPIQLLAWLCPA